MKLIYLLDLSASFLSTKMFKQAIREIYEQVNQHQCCNHEIIVYGFAKKVHKLTEDDVRELYHYAQKFDGEVHDLIIDNFEFSTYFKPLAKLLGRLGYTYYTGYTPKIRVIIYSDFEFADFEAFEE